MELVETEDAATQFIIAKERREIAAHRADQALIDGHRDVIAKQRSCERGWMITRAGAEDVGFDRIRQRSGERELVILEFLIKLMKGAQAEIVIAFDQKG